MALKDQAWQPFDFLMRWATVSLPADASRILWRSPNCSSLHEVLLPDISPQVVGRQSFFSEAISINSCLYLVSRAENVPTEGSKT